MGRKTAAESLRNSDQLREEFSASAVYGQWLAEIDRLEASTISLSGDDRDAFENSLSLGNRLFPLIEAISWTLFGAGARLYLNELGIAGRDAHLIVTIFRNGHAHNSRGYRLRYDDGEVAWTVVASAGSGGFRPFIKGVERAFTYESTPGGAEATLYVARLAAALVRADLEERSAADLDGKLNVIVGQAIQGKMPTP